MAVEDGFFSRWSRRKAEARPPAEPAADSQPLVGAASAPPQAGGPNPDAVAAAPAPTLADVEQLTPDADFSRFVSRSVLPQVRNAALKKLFADPHFNVMDGLDIYIDDYSVASPLEPELVSEMLASPFFSPPKAQEPPVEPAAPPASDAEAPVAATPIQPERDPEAPSTPTPPHDHADLQLQPDPAAGPDSSGPGAG